MSRAAPKPRVVGGGAPGRSAPAAARFACDGSAPPVDTQAMAAEDAEDIRASLDGDGRAYERLVRRYQEQVARRLWRFTRDAGELSELVHEVFVEAYFSLPGYRREAPLLHWLARIATRVGYRFWKARRRRAADVPLEEWDGAASPDPRRPAQLVDELLGHLAPRDRLVVTLLYLEGRSVAEAARLIGWSQTMIRVQAFRARRKLRALLAEAGVHGPPGGEEKR